MECEYDPHGTDFDIRLYLTEDDLRIIHGETFHKATTNYRGTFDVEKFHEESGVTFTLGCTYNNRWRRFIEVNDLEDKGASKAKHEIHVHMDEEAFQTMMNDPRQTISSRYPPLDSKVTISIDPERVRELQSRPTASRS